MYRIGIIPIGIINQFEIYNFYLDALKVNEKVAKAMTLVHFDISRQYLYTTIKRLEEPL